MTKRKISVFGATGSIGRNTLKVLKEQGGTDTYECIALTGGHNVELLAEQARELQPQYVVTAYEAQYHTLKALLHNTNIAVSAGEGALLEVAREETDWCMAAISGIAGVKVAHAALASTRVMALATKECLVCAGDLFLQRAETNQVNIIPVDSEHNAIFQVFDFAAPETVRKIILTASGGPFRTWSLEKMRTASVEDALLHPTWSMGQHITIDSATMFNKAMEMIEAQKLFGLRADQIEVLVHPESIIHSMVEYTDGSILAQMGASDMCIPIRYALGWPERLVTPISPLNFSAIKSLTFEEPDTKRFKALDIAFKVMLEESQGAGCILNAAKEVAVQAFLDKKIGFLDIEKVIVSALENVDYTCKYTDMDSVVALDTQTRSYVTEFSF